MSNEFESIDSFASEDTPTGQDVLAVYDMEDVDIVQDVLIVVAFGVAFHVLFGLVLWKFHRGKR